MVEFKQTISKDTVENVIVTALEGGSNYWYLLPTPVVSLIKELTPDMDKEPLALRMVEAINNGGEIPIHDVETEETLGVISKKSIAENTPKLYSDGHGDKLQLTMDGFGDAGDADVVFQYWVMGELVFG